MSNTLIPLMTTSLGRSGSTLLMSILNEHKQIIIDGNYPYEKKVASNLFININKCPNFVKYNSLFLFLIQKYISLKYKRLNSANRKILNSIYFSEKNFYCENYIWQVYPNAKEIFLVRDPVDIISSTLKFNKKRGTVKFGRQFYKTDDEYIFSRAKFANQRLTNRWENYKSKSLLVKYENLIKYPHETIISIFDYLNLEISLSNINSIVKKIYQESDIYVKHSTNKSPECSIGSGYKFLDKKEIDLCKKAFIDYCSTFGYD